MVSAVRHLPTLVVGGGIGGLAAALAVAHQGHRVHVVERGDGFGELGAGIQISANATRVLAEFGVLAQVRERAVCPTQIVMFDAVTGHRLTALRLGADYREHFGYPYLVVHRGDLLDVLLEACRAHRLVSLETGREVSSVSPRRNVVEVHFADGDYYVCDAVIGADGLRSTVRRILSAQPPVSTGYVTYRGAVPAGGNVAEEVRVWVGPNIHLVCYPIRRGELHNLAAVFRMSAQRGGGPDALDASFAHTCGDVRRAVASLNRHRYWDVNYLAPLRRWGRGRVSLLGDAAHAMVQYLAQGACQALEDAQALGIAVGASPIPEALRAYERSRQDKANRCGQAARVWGQLWHTSDPLVRGLRDRVLALRADADYSEVEWLHGFVGSAAVIPSSAHRTVYS